MIVFSTEDVKRLLIAKQKKILRWAVLGTLLIFLTWLSSPLLYEAQATFKQSSSRADQSFDLKNLIRTFSTEGPETSSKALMLSDTVLEKTIQHLGLQAELKTSSKVANLLKTIKKNVLAEMSLQNRNEEACRFSSIIYRGESPLVLQLKRTSDTDYDLFDRRQFLKSGQVGKPLVLDDFKLTIDHLPPSIPCSKELTFVLNPLQSEAARLRKALSIKPTREDKSLLQIQCQDIDRKRSAEIVNTLMAMYEKHLVEDNKMIIGSQLAYLRQRQEELSAKLDQDVQDHAKALRQNLQSEGFLGIKDEINFILESLQTHQQRLDETEVELRQIDEHLAKASLEAQLAPSPSKLVEQYAALLARQLGATRELLLHVQQKASLIIPSSEASDFSHIFSHYDLQSVAQEFNQALHHLNIDDPASLQAFQSKQHETETIFQDVLDHLMLREASLHRGNHLLQSFENHLTGIRLESARSLFDYYSRQFDDLHAQLKQIIFMRDRLFDPHFEISTLSNVLSDPVTQQIVQRSGDLEAQLCDDINRSTKDRLRLKKMLAIHKRFLDSHLDQTLQLGKVRIELIKEKISSLSTIMKTLLQQEKNILDSKIAELKQSMQTLPDLWVHENRLKFKTELTKGMMEGLVHIAETKNLSHYLYQVESRPLDKAKPPLAPLRPFIFFKSLLTFLILSLLMCFSMLIRALLQGMPVSLATLQQLGEQISGTLSFNSPTSLSETDQDTLRRIVAFLTQQDSFTKKIVAVIGEKQTQFLPALATLLKKHRLSSCVVDCSFDKIVSKEEEGGLLQLLQEAMTLSSSLRSHPSYDFLPVGGSSSDSVELLKSTAFQALLQNLSNRYDFVFLLSRTPPHSLEADILIHQSDCSIAVAETSLDILLKPFNSSRQKEKKHVTFIQYPVCVEG